MEAREALRSGVISSAWAAMTRSNSVAYPYPEVIQPSELPHKGGRAELQPASLNFCIP